MEMMLLLEKNKDGGIGKIMVEIKGKQIVSSFPVCPACKKSMMIPCEVQEGMLGGVGKIARVFSYECSNSDCRVAFLPIEVPEDAFVFAEYKNAIKNQWI